MEFPPRHRSVSEKKSPIRFSMLSSGKSSNTVVGSIPTPSKKDIDTSFLLLHSAVANRGNSFFPLCSCPAELHTCQLLFHEVGIFKEQRGKKKNNRLWLITLLAVGATAKRRQEDSRQRYQRSRKEAVYTSLEYGRRAGNSAMRVPDIRHGWVKCHVNLELNYICTYISLWHFEGKLD